MLLEGLSLSHSFCYLMRTGLGPCNRSAYESSNKNNYGNKLHDK